MVGRNKKNPSQAYSFTGTAGDSYTFYVSLQIPVNITTDFLGNPTSFGSYFGWSTVPYNTNLLGFSNTDTNKTQTVYGFSSLPSSFPSGENYPSTSYYVDEGFWNNGNFNDTGGIIANDGSPFGCFFSYPEISYCLATDGNLEATTSFTTSYQYWQQHISIGSGFYTLRGLYTFNPSYTGAYLSLPQVPVEYNIVKGIYNNLQLTNYPTNIALNYGYYIPIYLGFNDNITYTTILGNEQVGNCDFLNKKTYYTISAYLYNMSNNQSWVCDESLHPIKTSPSGIIYGALVTQPTQTLTISIYQNQEEATYQANETNGVYQIGDSASYLTGFTSTPNLIVEGADTTYTYADPYEYQIGITGIPTLSEENAYGFFNNSKINYIINDYLPTIYSVPL